MNPEWVRFPSLEARDLEGRPRALPDTFATSLSLVIIAFRREQQAMVDTWIAWFSAIAWQHPSLSCYEVPVIATRWSPARPLIERNGPGRENARSSSPYAHRVYRRPAGDRFARQRRREASVSCCANPCRASFPSACFVIPGSRSPSPSPTGSFRRSGDARVTE